jgi:hypothetical protein
MDLSIRNHMVALHVDPVAAYLVAWISLVGLSVIL